MGDEMAWAAAFLFLASILMSFLQISKDGLSTWLDKATDSIFLIGVLVLTLSALATSFELR